jgi:hypothetical protein
MAPPRPVNPRVQVRPVWRTGSGLAKPSGRSHFGAVVVTGGIVTALALLLVSQPAAVDAPDGNPVRIEVADAGDPAWVLARIDVLLDGVPQAPAADDAEEAPGEADDQEEGETSEGPRPVWSGVVAPGPHNLAALLVFRPRDADLAGNVDRTIRVEAQHLFPARPIRPLVLLITPVRPTPAPAPDLLLARYTLSPE